MSEEVATATADMRAIQALQSQFGQAHADLLVAQADAETLMNAIRYATQADTLEERLRGWGALCNLARTAHPGQVLADEVTAAQAARWACASCGAEFPRRRTDDPNDLCSKCVEVEVLIKQSAKVTADNAELIRLASLAVECVRGLLYGDGTDAAIKRADRWMPGFTRQLAAEHPGAQLLAIATAAHAWAHARETLNGIDAAETALLAAVAGAEKGASE